MRPMTDFNPSAPTIPAAPSPPASEAAPPAGLAKGYAAIIFAIIIWSGWIVATRHQVHVATPLDISLLRYCLPALVLAPVWLRRGIVPRGEDWRLLMVMAVGWGGGFVWLTAKGLETVPASLFGPMVPATLPLVVSLWDRVQGGVPISGTRGAGLALILGSIGLIVGPALVQGEAGVLAGAPYLLLAAIGWASFTIAFRRSTLTGLEATAYVCLWSTPALIVAGLLSDSKLGALDWDMIAWLVVSQGLLSGICAVACFAYAVRHLGAARTSSFTSLVPMGAAIGGWLVLGETVGPLGWAAVVCACLGVAVVNGALGR